MRTLRILISSALLVTGGLQADTTGEVAVQTAEEATSNGWQNWVFAGSMLLCAGAAILIVSLNNGHAADSSN